MQDADRKSTVYGVHPVSELLRTRAHAVEKVYFRQDPRRGPLFDLLKECRRRRIPYQVVPPLKLDKMVPGAAHQGVIAHCSARPYDSFEDITHAAAASPYAGLALVPASVEDPHNLGAIIRSAVAFGVHGVLVERHHTAPLSEAAVKSSVGMLEHIRIARPRSLEGPCSRSYIVPPSWSKASRKNDAM